MPKTVLLTAPYMKPFVEKFRPVFDHYQLDLVVPEVEERMEEEDIQKFAGQFDGVICGDDQYTQKAIEACLPRLKVISKWGTGIDSIDKEFAETQGVLVGNTLNAFTQPVADTVLGYILAFARRQPWMDKDVKKGKWVKISGHALNESTLGVIGVGNIGKAVIRRAKAFGMKILGNDIVDIDPNFIKEFEVEMLSLDELLAKADYVSLNCDLNPTSYHLMDSNALNKMKESAVLINTARGPVVNEENFIKALNNKQIAGAALDVFEYEPLSKDSPLLNFENLMLAPHNSNSSPTAWEHVHWNSIRNLLIGLNIPHEDLSPELLNG
ncbi:MAG: phosphoglycerate dehydrogenase [Chloroflexi bacterium]|jgi:D-3-phosphoglycerate dehydrogenase / 2-oxoglutarate reductase|nr:phosphoglycerate dehydrogenase [Chloroflexota bacterium]MBT3670044.1 phosphoglycerate dehydrogenase [Chloroflexota bacterium]MBT4003531.1 phosphoglycerate dehydrogenase [Chloroflexota bacterium]MBT4306754.1 phosphoglycerate dehydrogenase [Chloroflexota bacterium]MBT4532930.1 phosphoglycerate dehydrogenase [Chloroflexota bacterium]